jgi:exopolyphosphatase/guanosine-5'-triphosphate,3'-diphosphate pyrophosphatase
MKVGERVAAIDIGTHSVRLLSGVFTGERVLGAKRLVITRLGEGLVHTGVLGDAAIARTVDAVRGFAEQARTEGVLAPVYCYATSAAREAANGRALLEALRGIEGVEAEIIGGDEEALLAYRGASALGAVVLDIGGGSTELSRMDGGALLTRSVPLGTVTSLESALGVGDAIGPLTVMAMAERARTMVGALCEGVLAGEKTSALVGVGGTATQLAMLFLALPSYDAQRVHGFRMELSALDELQQRLVNMTHAMRKAMPGMHPARADVIVSGCLIARMVLARSGANTFSNWVPMIS